jgi:hypothetical protein
MLSTSRGKVSSAGFKMEIGAERLLQDMKPIIMNPKRTV